MTTSKVTLLVAVILLGATATGTAALEGPGRALVVSNVLQLSADTLRTGFVTKEFIVPYAGVVRIRWQLKSDGKGPAIVNLTVLGAIHNCQASTSQTTFQAGTCDLSVVAGDSVRVTALGNTDFNTFESSTPSVKGVRVFWKVVDSAGTGAVLLD